MPCVKSNGSKDMFMPPLYRRNVYRIGGDIYLYDEIDPETAFKLIKLLEEATDDYFQSTSRTSMLQGAVSTSIFLHINSPGGEFYSTIAVYDYIRQMDLPIVCVIEGIAASGASIIAQACAIREMSENSSMLIHEVRSAAWGKYSEISDEKICLDQIMKTMKKIYMKRSKLKEADLDEALRHDIIWDAEKCKEIGLIDRIVEDENRWDDLWEQVAPQVDENVETNTAKKKKVKK